MATQHASLSPERWRRYSLDQQILMIANEMNRAGRLTRGDDAARRRHAYERILNLTDLTTQVNAARGLRRELLRWRELLAELYLLDAAQPDRHAELFRCLLLFRPEAAKQIPFLLPQFATRAG